MNMQTEEAEIETEIDDDAATEVLDRGDDFTPETVDEAPAAPVEDEAQAARMIPKSRFDEVNNAKKMAEQENARLLAELEALRTGAAPAAQAATSEPEVPPAVTGAHEIADLERQKYVAMMDGDEEKVVELGMKINDILSSEAENRALRKIENRNSQAEYEQSIEQAVSDVFSQYPQFDDFGDQADPDAIEAMVAMRNHYITEKGMSAAQAIVAAANKVAAMYSFGTPAAAADIDPRTSAAIKRGAAVAAAQPNTSAVGVGTRQDAPRANISTMSEDEFDALPETEKRRMRGD